VVVGLYEGQGLGCGDCFHGERRLWGL
jgi:hypothetical protein